jgi:cobalt-zinc-cadmium efflux system membrane fusion protein
MQSLSNDRVDPAAGQRAAWRRERKLAIAGAIAFIAVSGTWFLTDAFRDGKATTTETEVSSQKRTVPLYYPTPTQWATLTVEQVQQQTFRSALETEGKIAVNEDVSTPIFSPYSGRITKLMAKAGDNVERGQLLFVVEATDTVQALNDFIAASTAANKARAALDLARITEKRNKDLYAGKAVPLKELQAAQAALLGAENDARSSNTAIEASRNRLRMLGRSDDEIAAFERNGKISPDTPVYAPIGGTVVQRKVGPGQYVSAGASDPVFVIGDLSTVWLTAFVRETEAPQVKLGQNLDFTVLAVPDRVFEAEINYVDAALDPSTRRLLVRATIDNRDGLLKPEMFANVTIFIDKGGTAPAVPRSAIMYDGDDAASIWVVRDDNAIEMRHIKLGLTADKLVEVKQGLHPGEKIITKGSLFFDHPSAGS